MHFLEMRDSTCIFRFLVSFEKIGIWVNTWSACLPGTNWLQPIASREKDHRRN